MSGPARACASCAAGLAHCHGTLIVHETGFFECTEGAGCQAVLELHELVLPCLELDPACRCDR